MDAAHPDGRPRRPANSEWRKALALLGSGLAIAVSVALVARWRYNHQLERAVENYRLAHPGEALPTVPHQP